jgi:hypothetical protein
LLLRESVEYAAPLAASKKIKVGHCDLFVVARRVSGTTSSKLDL